MAVFCSILQRRETVQIRVRDELGRLHPDEKIRDGGKLHRVNIFRQLLRFLQPAPIQQKDSRSLQGTVFQQLILLPLQIRENADGDGGLQVGVGREGAGEVKRRNILLGDARCFQNAIDHGVGCCLGVQILVDVGLGEIEGRARCALVGGGVESGVFFFVSQENDPLRCLGIPSSI